MPASLPLPYPRFQLAASLTVAQTDFFQTHGFLHFTGFASPELVAELRSAADELAARWLASGVRSVFGVPVQRGHGPAGETLLQRLGFVSLFSEVFGVLARDPRLSALLPLLGAPGRVGEREKDGMVYTHYVAGPANNFHRMGWHTDSLRDVFYGHRPRPLLNVGLHLDDIAACRGGLRVLPGTHRQGWLGLLGRKLYFADHRPDSAEVAIETRVGDLTVHCGRLWHRVAPVSVSRRVVYLPLLAGPYEPRHPDSPTLLYQRLTRFFR